MPVGILRIAENERTGARGPPLEILEVYGVAPVDEPHGTVLGHRSGEAQIAVKPAVDRGRHEYPGSGWRERLQPSDETRVDAGGHDDGAGIDVQVVASLVPVHNRLDVRLGPPQIAPILVCAALGKGFGDARRRSEVHVRDAHRDLDVLPERRDRAVPLTAVCADTVVGLIEVVGQIQLLGLYTARLGRRRGFRTDRAKDRRHSRTLQERSAIQLRVLRHRFGLLWLTGPRGSAVWEDQAPPHHTGAGSGPASSR